MNPRSAILAVDVGNTRAKFGLFQLTEQGVAVPSEIIALMLTDTTDLAGALCEWVSLQSNSLVDAAVVAGSHPEARDRLLSAWPLPAARPMTIAAFDQIPIRMDVDAPDRVGIDRLLNAFAARRFFGRDKSAIIIDSGTATTVDLLTSDNIFRGGSILPGLRLSAHALHDYTARLPFVDVDEELVALPDLPGRNTEAAMKAGLFYGQLGAVRELSSRLARAARERFSETSPPQLIVTGGGGRQLVDQLPEAVYIDSLALNGLAMLRGLPDQAVNSLF